MITAVGIAAMAGKYIRLNVYIATYLPESKIKKNMRLSPGNRIDSSMHDSWFMASQASP